MSVSLEGDEDKPSVALVVGVMLVATLEVLDVTVVNIALPHIMGSFGATPDQVTWMITSYLIATVIVMPLTGYFVSRYGRQRTMLVGVVGFTVTSLACGLSCRTFCIPWCHISNRIDCEKRYQGRIASTFDTQSHEIHLNRP